MLKNRKMKELADARSKVEAVIMKLLPPEQQAAFVKRQGLKSKLEAATADLEVKKAEVDRLTEALHEQTNKMREPGY